MTILLILPLQYWEDTAVETHRNVVARQGKNMFAKGYFFTHIKETNESITIITVEHI